MAGYDYNYRSGYSTGKGVGPLYTNEWGRTRYATDDDECRTVIVDADGTQRTIIGCTPLNKPAGYTTKSETIVHEGRVHPPLLPSYRHSSPPKVEPVRNYGYDDKWRRPSSPPRRVDDFPTRGHNEGRAGPFNGVDWRQQPQQTRYNGTTGYGDYGDYNNKTLYKATGNTIRNDKNYDDYYRKNDRDMGGPVNMISNAVGNRGRPSRTSTLAAAALPLIRGGDGNHGKLSAPTDDMEKALHYLRESAKTSSWPRTT